MNSPIPRLVHNASSDALGVDVVTELPADGLQTETPITVWLSRIIDDTGLWSAADDVAVKTAEVALAASIDDLVAAWRNTSARVVAVSNEVGSGIVPDHVSGRRFRDELGALNARLAASSDDVLLVHGTPDSDLAYFLETVAEDGLRPATAAEIEARAGTTGAAVILCGHTHVPRVAKRPDGRLVVNPGSVGLPAFDDDHPFPHVVETGSPHARYAILSDEGDGWSTELLAIAYDWEQAARDAEANGRADWARALRTGRV